MNAAEIRPGMKAHLYGDMTTDATPQSLISEESPRQEIVLAQAQRHSPSDARDKAVADLTSACYARASQLQLTREEIEALKADFADEAFQPGAAGKENLIYIEHAALRERLDNVLGMGQWCPLQIRRWADPFEYEKEIWENNRRTGQKKLVVGQVVYVDLILLIRGCFVASAIGSMDYYPVNHTQDYGDAAEGAETAALRRCCKHIGIGLQAWRKDWCLGWWQRRTQRQNAPRANSPRNAPACEPEPPALAGATNQTRMKVLHELKAAPGEPNRLRITAFLEAQNWLAVPGEPESWVLGYVPNTPRLVRELGLKIAEWEAGQEVAP